MEVVVETWPVFYAAGRIVQGKSADPRMAEEGKGMANQAPDAGGRRTAGHGDFSLANHAMFV
jgi:hypothetical protein